MVKSTGNMRRRNSLLMLLISLGIIILANVLGSMAYKRFDLTKEKRYSISEPTKNLCRNLDDYVTVDIYLDGKLNKGLKRLRTSTEDLMKEFKAYGGGNFEYHFIDPIEGKTKEEQRKIIQDFGKKGLGATNLKDVNENGTEEKIIFPCALISYKSRQMPVNFLENQVGYSPEDILNHSIIGLEYKFSSAIRKMMMYRKPRVAFLTGNGELQPIEMLDYARTLTENLYEVKSVNLQENYRIAPVDFDAIIIAKPTIKFEEKDKFKLDQYVMNGGKVIWLIDEVWADMDSLRNQQQMFMAYTQDLNLDDMLFNYGARINGDLIQDAQNDNPIPLVVGNLGNSPQTQLFPWMYFPVFISGSEHPIVRNLDPVSGFFANTIDTIKNSGIKKTILLTTSPYSRALLSPVRVHLGIIREQPDPSKFKQPNLATAVLLEGKFKSVFKGRVASSYLEIGDTVKELKYKEESVPNKMIVISDGDVIRNELQAGGGIWPLGYYNITGQTFANKDFLINAMEYLVDDSRLIESRGKDIKVRKLDMIKVKDEAMKWRIINIGLPLLLIILFGIIYNVIRRWRYAR